jgi:hypothetical protein
MSFMPDTALLFADHQLTETGKIAPDALSSRTRIMSDLMEIGVLKHCLSTAWSIAQASARGSVSIAIFDCLPTRSTSMGTCLSLKRGAQRHL